MVKYWKIGFTAGGGGDIWDEFVEHSVAAIGWGYQLGDLTDYRDQLRMYDRWRKLKCGSRKGFYQLWTFYDEIHPKDKLVAYGKGKYVGVEP